MHTSSLNTCKMPVYRNKGDFDVEEFGFNSMSLKEKKQRVTTCVLFWISNCLYPVLLVLVSTVSMQSSLRTII